MNNIKGGNELINIDIFEKTGLEEDMRVADLGCGNLGHFSIPAAKIVGEDGKVFAVDILKSVLQSVESRAEVEGLKNLEVVWSNLEIVGATKIKDASIDVALVVNMLFQSTKDDQVIKEAYRLVKPSGKLLVIDWTKKSAPFGPPVADRIEQEQVKQFAKQAGFVLQEEFQAGPFHFGLIFNK